MLPNPRMYADAGRRMGASRPNGLLLSGVEHLGVVQLVSDYPADIADVEKSRWRDIRDLDARRCLRSVVSKAS